MDESRTAAELDDVLNGLAGEYRHIIFDTPPLLSRIDSIGFLRHAEAYILVTKQGSTTLNQIRAIRRGTPADPVTRGHLERSPDADPPLRSPLLPRVAGIDTVQTMKLLLAFLIGTFVVGGTCRARHRSCESPPSFSACA